jgi:thiamine-monophosphate kinase
MNASDTSEDELIQRLVSRVPTPAPPADGPGDDCAVLDLGGDELLLLKTDALVEGVHYLPGEEGGRVGWKALGRVVSDFAAMGGRPSEYLVTLGVPGGTSVSWLERVYDGMADCMRCYGGHVVGGETVSVPEGSPVLISIAGVGRVRRGHVAVRSGGRPGDRLLVTGSLGGSWAGKHLDFQPRMEQATWLAERGALHAMMDLSDGLARDLPRLAAASGCGFRLDRDAIPCSAGCRVEQALNDGEDFELLAALDPDECAGVMRDWNRQFPQLSLTVIGHLVEKGEGEELSGGWDHFQSNITESSD